MKIKDHLRTDSLEKLQKINKQGNKKKKRKKQSKEEKVDWINIMGIDRDRYGRGRGGAMRRK